MRLGHVTTKASEAPGAPAAPITTDDIDRGAALAIVTDAAATSPDSIATIIEISIRSPGYPVRPSPALPGPLAAPERGKIGRKPLLRRDIWPENPQKR